MSRIPAYDAKNPDGMLIWFAEMAKRDLLFHPDDEPADIVSTSDGTRLFSAAEAAELRNLLENMFANHGDSVHEAAHPVYMHALGLQLDS